MRKNIVLYGIDTELWNEFRKWCMDRGIEVSGRGSGLSEQLQEILKEHIQQHRKEKKEDRFTKLKDTLERNIIKRGLTYAKAELVEEIFRSCLNINSLNLIRYQYAKMLGYIYDKKLKAYKTPVKEPIKNNDEEAKKIIQATLQYAKQKSK